MSDGGEDTPARGRSNRYRQLGPKLSREEVKRQGDITQLAFQLLGGRDRAIGFLNNFDAGLDGRPLDVAIASDEGADKVKLALQMLADGRGSMR